jgi:hypothetical protein
MFSNQMLQSAPSQWSARAAATAPWGTFALPDDNYFRLEFRRNSSGTVDAMLFREASGIYLVERELVSDQGVTQIGCQRNLVAG